MKDTTKKIKGKNKIMMIISSIIALLILVALLGWLCVGYFKNATLNISNPVATMEIQDYGTIKIELYPDKAPETVANFIRLANNGFYDGIKIDEIYQDSILQVASAKDDGETVKLSDLYTNLDGTIDVDAYCELTGAKKSECDNINDEDYELIDDSYCIKGEFISNSFEENDLNLTEGVIVMLRSDYTQYSSQLLDESYNSATSQFFILTSNERTGLSGYYAGFGKIIEGMDIAKEIAGTELTTEDEDEDTEATIPVNDIVITSIRVETNGIDYGLPSIYDPFDLLTWYYSNYYSY